MFAVRQGRKIRSRHKPKGRGVTLMRKRLLFVATAVMLTGLIVMPSVALAGARIQDNGGGTVSLDRVGEETPEQATATAKFDLDSNDQGWYRMQMELRVRNLPERAGKVYETWLVDTDSDTDDSVGAFQTDNDGDGGFTVTKRIVFFAPYDKIIVTSEQKNDTNPTRDGPVVLRGSMED